MLEAAGDEQALGGMRRAPRPAAPQELQPFLDQLKRRIESDRELVEKHGRGRVAALAQVAGKAGEDLRVREADVEPRARAAQMRDLDLGKKHDGVPAANALTEV